MKNVHTDKFLIEIEHETLDVPRLNTRERRNPDSLSGTELAMLVKEFEWIRKEETKK